MSSIAIVELLIPIYLTLLLVLTGFTGTMWWSAPSPVSRLSFLIFAGSSAQLVVLAVAGQGHPLVIALATATGVVTLMPILGLLGAITGTDTPYLRWLQIWTLGIVGCVGLWAVGMPFEVYAMASTLGIMGMGLWLLWTLRGHVRDMSTAGRVLWGAALVMCLHALDFPFLRLNDDPNVLLFAFSVAMFNILLAGMSAPSVVAEASTREAAAARADAALLAARSDAIADYASTLTHEVRNPLQAVLGYTDLLQEQIDLGVPVEELREDVEYLRLSGAHLMSLVDDALDLSKVDAGRMELDLQPTEVATVLADVEAATRPQVADHDNALEMPVTEAIGEVDGRRLRQCLINLVANAAKFTKKGTIRLEFEGGPMWTFRVVDTGIGMAPQTLSRMFEPFAQASTSSGGTGIGLALTRQLAVRMGGSLTATSEPGVGSTFVLRVRPDHR